MTQAKRLLITSQLILFTTVLICITISPNIPFSLPQGGISNFGTESQTIMVFSLGFWTSTVLLVISALRTKTSLLKNVLIGYIPLISLLVLSTYPYKLNQFFENLHIFIGFVLAIYQFIGAFVLSKRSMLNFGIKVASIFFFISILSAISTIFATGLLFTSQLTGGVGYALVLICSRDKTIKQGDYSCVEA